MPSVSTEQVRAFVALARCGSIRAAASELCLSEEGARSRLLALEERLGVNLYDKHRGRRGEVVLTDAGQTFLNKAIPFVEEARELSERAGIVQPRHDIKIAVDQYLVLNVLADLARDFRAQFPDMPVHLLTRTEQQVVSTLRMDASLALGMCAPEELPTDLVCRPWFSVGWRFVAPLDNPLLHKSSVTLSEIAAEPLIIFEPGCSARQNLLQAFYQRNLTPRIIAEAASTQVIMRMVETGFGTAIIPVPPAGSLTTGMQVGEVRISDAVRAVEFAILSRPDSLKDSAVQTFLNYILHNGPQSMS